MAYKKWKKSDRFAQGNHRQAEGKLAVVCWSRKPPKKGKGVVRDAERAARRSFFFFDGVPVN